MTDNDSYENLKRLVAAHPLLFEDFFKGRSSLPSGWYDLVDRLCNDIEVSLGPAGCEGFAVLQLKEKLAGLRFNFLHRDREVRQRVRALVDAAELKSSETCQRCGAAASVRNHGGWLTALCDVHAEPGKGPG